METKVDAGIWNSVLLDAEPCCEEDRANGGQVRREVGSVPLAKENSKREGELSDA